MDARLLFLHALSPLHAGTGQGSGVIDLPIAREKATNLPYVPGSSLKGVLRDNCQDDKLRVKVFGPDTINASDHAGSAQFADVRLLLLPIRSLSGTFAWITSPYLLRRLAREAKDASARGLPAQVPTPSRLEEGLIAETGAAITAQGKIYLEDLDLNAKPDAMTSQWAAWLGQHIFPGDPTWQAMLAERICIVQDDVLSFLLNTATEVIARIKLLEDAKTVQEGGLWYEEALPTETVLTGVVVATPVKASNTTSQDVFNLLDGLNGKTLQVGGKATVGRGLCTIQIG